MRMNHIVSRTIAYYNSSSCRIPHMSELFSCQKQRKKDRVRLQMNKQFLKRDKLLVTRLWINTFIQSLMEALLKKCYMSYPAIILVLSASQQIANPPDKHLVIWPAEAKKKVWSQNHSKNAPYNSESYRPQWTASQRSVAFWAPNIHAVEMPEPRVCGGPSWGQ